MNKDCHRIIRIVSLYTFLSSQFSSSSNKDFKYGLRRLNENLFNLKIGTPESNTPVLARWCHPCVCFFKHNWTVFSKHFCSRQLVVQYSNRTSIIFQLQVRQARRNQNELIVYSIHMPMGLSGWLSKCASSKTVCFLSSIQYAYIKLHYPVVVFLIQVSNLGHGSSGRSRTIYLKNKN